MWVQPQQQAKSQQQAKPQQQAHDRSCRSEWHRKTIVEITNGSAFRMGDLCIRRGLQSGLDCGEIKPAILLAASNHPTLAREEPLERGRVSIQAVEAHDDVGQRKRKCRRICRDSLQGLSQFFTVIAVSWTSKGAHPLMGERL